MIGACSLVECPPPEPYMWVYALHIFLSSLMPLAAVVVSLRRDGLGLGELPLWLIIPAGVGLLYAVFIQYTFPVFAFLTAMLSQMAPAGATAIALIFGVGCWCMFWYTLVYTMAGRRTAY